MNILIVAGGSGTRLWPASRKKNPKQLLTFLNDKTLLQNTYERFSGTMPANRIFIATTKDYALGIQKQLPKVPKSNYSVEPALRNRAPAIGLAALIMETKYPGSNFITAWSDNTITPTGKFLSMLDKAERYLEKYPETTITIGVNATSAHTGLGYIKKGKAVTNGASMNLHSVDSFKEKPDLATAKKFFASGNYLWNTGMFIWKARTLLSLYEKHLPEIYAVLMRIKPHIGTSKQQAMINKLYPTMPTVEIEDGLIEKLRGNIVVIPANFTWADIGSWKVIKDIQAKGQGNISKGLHIDHDSNDTLIYNYTKNALVATLGLENIVVVATDGAILIADKHRSEELKAVIGKIKKDKRLEKFL